MTPRLPLGRAVAVGLEDPLLAALYQALAVLAAEHSDWRSVFAEHVAERMSIFLPEVRARLLAKVMLTDADPKLPVPTPSDQAQQTFVTIQLIEAAARLPADEVPAAHQAIRAFAWAAPVFELSYQFVNGECDDSMIEFATMGSSVATAVPIRGRWSGSLRARCGADHCFVRHALSDGPPPTFNGTPWPAGHTLWFKTTDAIDLVGQRLDMQGLTFMRAHQLGQARTRWLHGTADGVMLDAQSDHALARVHYECGCVIEEASDLSVNGSPCSAPVAVLPDDRIEIAGMSMSALRLMRLMNTGATHPAPWMVRLSDVSLVFKDGSRGLDEVSLTMQSGDLVAVMGPSGCGKSTLLSLLTGELRARSGQLVITPCAGHKPVFAIVPQDDVLFPELTVRENLACAAVLRGAVDDHERNARVADALAAVSMQGKAALRVGSVTDKILSGGERKRVNIALELAGTPHALLLDEPTSGLSSADAESVMSVLRAHADAGMLVVSVIHQPSRDVFELFDKVIVLDVGGRLAYFGTAAGAQRYFGAQNAAGNGSDREWSPEVILETLMSRRSTVDGRVQRRTYSPAFWQARYRAERRGHEPPVVSAIDENDSHTNALVVREHAPLIATTRTMLARELLRRAREWRGSLASCGIAALLAIVVGAVCRMHMPGSAYAFAKNPNIPAFCFLIVILVQFLGLSSSVQELVKDRAHRQRERLLHVPPWCWLLAKLPGLLLLLIAQAGIVVWCAGWFIKLPYAHAGLWFSLTLAGWCSLGMGLLVSSLPRMTERIALAAVPMLLVPQMILCGAKPFEFASLDHLRWPMPTPPHEAGVPVRPPWPATYMPSRWAYQATMCGLRDDPKIVRAIDVRVLRKTYARTKQSIDLWRTDHAAFAKLMGEQLDGVISDDEIRERIITLIRIGSVTGQEVSDAIGVFLPQAAALDNDLEPAWNAVFLDYATTQFPASQAGDSTLVQQSRWVLFAQGSALLLIAALIMRISPRAILDFIGQARRTFHRARRRRTKPSPSSP